MVPALMQRRFGLSVKELLKQFLIADQAFKAMNMKYFWRWEELTSDNFLNTLLD
jgi:hypothetical protein